MQNYQTFLEKIKRGLITYFGDSHTIELTRVVKNNGVVFQGVVIRGKDSNIGSTIYLEKEYRNYQNGSTMTEVLERVVFFYKEHAIEERMDVSCFREFSYVKKRLAYKVVNYEANRERLQQLPHVRFLDLALIAYCRLDSRRDTTASFEVRKDLLKQWGIEEGSLFEQARKNTPSLLPEKIVPINRILEEHSADSAEDSTMLSVPSLPLYVLTNRQQCHGAACMLYPGVLQHFAEEVEADLIILPSSVHEVLLLPVRGTQDTEALQEMVREINQSELLPEEVLSGRVYQYKRAEDQVCMALPEIGEF